MKRYGAILLAGLLLGAAAPESVRRGWWQVETTMLGARAAALARRCVTAPGRWVGDLLPPRLVASCSIDRMDDPFGSVWGRCPRGGTLTVTGVRRPDRVDLVVRRTARIGSNPHVTLTAVVQGVRIDAACPPPEINHETLGN